MEWIKKNWIGILVLIATVVFGYLAITANLKEIGLAIVMLIIVVFAVGLLYCFDKFVLVGYDTIEELKKGNVAVGLALLAYSYIIGSIISAVFGKMF